MKAPTDKAVVMTGRRISPAQPEPLTEKQLAAIYVVVAHPAPVAVHTMLHKLAVQSAKQAEMQN